MEDLVFSYQVEVEAAEVHPVQEVVEEVEVPHQALAVVEAGAELNLQVAEVVVEYLAQVEVEVVPVQVHPQVVY